MNDIGSKLRGTRSVMKVIEEKRRELEYGSEESRVCISRTWRDSIVGKDALMKIFAGKM